MTLWIEFVPCCLTLTGPLHVNVVTLTLDNQKNRQRDAVLYHHKVLPNNPFAHGEQKLEDL